MAGSILGGWIDGAALPAKLPLTAAEKIVLMPGALVLGTALSAGRALGDFGAAVAGPVRTPEGAEAAAYTKSATFRIAGNTGEALRQNVEKLGPEGVRAFIKKRREMTKVKVFCE
jgi:hypothetical protein